MGKEVAKKLQRENIIIDISIVDKQGVPVGMACRMLAKQSIVLKIIVTEFNIFFKDSFRFVDLFPTT